MRPVLIAGPTASGKSALALALAERDGGVIINADASQVYDCWRVLSARPDETDLTRAPHRLYGHVDGRRRYSAGDWLRDVAAALAEARQLGLRPVVVGGTGLYFHALTAGLAEIPDVPPEVRDVSEARIDGGDLAGLVAELDADTRARIDLRNPRRVQRAWEVLQASGRGVAYWHQAPPSPPLVPPETAATFVIDPEIYNLNISIAARLDVMVQDGALDEVRRVGAMSIDPSLPAARVLGATQLAAHLRGEIGLPAALDATAIATRQFAKRQRTWFRNRMAGWQRLDPAAEMLAAIPR